MTTAIVSVSQVIFSKALTPISSVLGKRNPIPVLNNALIECNESNLTLTAADSDMTLKIKLGKVDSSADFSTCTDAITFKNTTEALRQDGEVKIEYNDERSRLKVSSGFSEFVLPALDSGEFQKLEGGDWQVNFTIKSDTLLWLLKKTSFSMAQDEARRYLNGVYLHISEEDGKNFLCMVATDGHRLALSKTEVASDFPDIDGFIIPRKIVMELEKLLASNEDKEYITVSFSDSMVSFENDAFYLVGRLTDGNFPDYQKVIPTIGQHTMLVNVDELNKSVHRMLMVADNSNAVKFLLKEKKLTLEVKVTDGPSGKDEIAIDFDSEVEINFNGKYVCDICQKIGTNKLKISFENSSEAARIEGVKEEESNEGENAKGLSLFVLMPMRI